MRMYVVRLNPDPRDGIAYSAFPTTTEYRIIHESAPMNGFHEAVNFLPERGVVRGYLPPKHLASMRDGELFSLLTITAKTAKSGGDKIVGIQGGCRYVGETVRRGSSLAIGLTWHYYCPASLSFLFAEPIPDARAVVLGRNGKWVRGPTLEVNTAAQKRIYSVLSKYLKDPESTARLQLLAGDVGDGPLPAGFESESIFEGEVADAWKTKLKDVKGNPNPRQKEVQSFQFVRDPKVVAFTLKEANGICFDCKQKGPFISKTTRLPYLEVHHVHTLKDGGRDTPDNAVALCPNCHRARHYG